MAGRRRSAACANCRCAPALRHKHHHPIPISYDPRPAIQNHRASQSPNERQKRGPCDPRRYNAGCAVGLHSSATRSKRAILFGGRGQNKSGLHGALCGHGSQARHRQVTGRYGGGAQPRGEHSDGGLTRGAAIARWSRGNGQRRLQRHGRAGRGDGGGPTRWRCLALCAKVDELRIRRRRDVGIDSDTIRGRGQSRASCEGQQGCGGETSSAHVAG